MESSGDGGGREVHINERYQSDQGWSRRSRGRRIRPASLFKSPTIKAPAATPLIKLPFTITTPKVPSSPTVTSKPYIDVITTPYDAISGSPPRKLLGISRRLFIKGRAYFEYSIPDNAFVDEEDGGTSSLQLAVNQMREAESGVWRVDFNIVPWLRFDPSRQVLYGVPPVGMTKDKTLLGSDCKQVCLFIYLAF